MAFRILPMLIIAVMVSFPAHVQSQGVGRVTGRILAKENGQPVGDATVELVGGRTVRSAALAPGLVRPASTGSSAPMAASSRWPISAALRCGPAMCS